MLIAQSPPTSNFSRGIDTGSHCVVLASMKPGEVWSILSLSCVAVTVHFPVPSIAPVTNECTSSDEFVTKAELIPTWTWLLDIEPWSVFVEGSELLSLFFSLEYVGSDWLSVSVEGALVEGLILKGQNL